MRRPLCTKSLPGRSGATPPPVRLIGASPPPMRASSSNGCTHYFKSNRLLASQLARGDRLLTTWIAAQRAEAASRLGLRGETVRHLDTAERETGGGTVDDRYFGEWSEDSLEAYRGTCWLYLGAYEEAI